ncbi:MAG: hypothetical protein H0U92_03380 [Actinobacteria bacterium]|nr:hypothetical protein [Actinomycetota bacterium]
MTGSVEGRPPLLGRHDAVPRRRWQWLLPLLVGLAVVGLAAGLVVRFTNRNDNPRHAVSSYLDAVQHGKTRRAYGQLCDAFHKAVSYEDFDAKSKAERASSGGVLGSKIARIEPRTNGQRLATYTVRREAGDTVVDAALVREHGDWRLCGFRPRPLSDDDTSVPPAPVDTGGTTTTR